MARVVNLNRARKDRARDEKRRKADANAALHGLSKADKTLARARADRARRGLDGHRVDDGTEPDGSGPDA